ncbi:MAG TPA: tetratricopeptide repeat protein, partial [Isosphaeraceae bacterium]|nr:tetratricopeptide repeat protein [Isosphaeraceae bacterium]
PAAERQWGEAEYWVEQADRVNPGNVDVPILRAEVWLARNQPDRARYTLQKALDAHPDRVEPWLALAALAAREETRTPGTDKPEAALAVLDQARAKLGDRIELQLARARFLAGLGGDYGRRGLAELAGALDRISGNDQRALLNSLAAAYQIVGDTKRAEQLWSRLAEQERGDPVVRLALFELAAARNDDLAMQRLISQLRDIEGEDGASWRFAEAKRLVVTARQSPNDQQGDRSRASTALKQAHDLLVEAAKRRASWPLVPALDAEIALLENDPNEAIEQYRQAIKLGDRRIEVVRALVQLLFQRGRLDEAREALRELPPDTPLSGPMGQMAAELTLRDKNPKRGLELTSQVVRADSKDYRDQVWRGSMFSRAGPERRAEAETAFRQAISLAGGKEPVTWLALVDFLARSNQRDKALAAIKQAERDLPSDLRSLTLAQCWGIVGDREKAVIQYQAALKAQPSNVLVLRSFADFLVQAGQPREAQTLLRQLLDPALNAPAEEVRLARRILAVSLPDEGDPRKLQEALALIDANLSTDVPSDRDLQTKMLLLTRQPGRRTEAIRMMEEIVRGSTATPRDQLVLAQLYDEDKQWPAARRILLQLVASQGDDPLYLAYAAGALLQHNDPDAAQGMIGRLESREPNSLRTLELKVRWLLAKGRPREGIPPLEQYARANPSDRIVIARLIEMLSPPEGSATAEAIYRDVAAQSDQPYGVLILAQYYARHGRLDQALDLCERAGNAVPPDVVARNFMMSLDLVRPRPSDAQIKRVDHWLDLAVERHPNLVELRIQQALIRTLQGRYDESAAIYRRI